jgi:hypothetical protein
MDKGLVKSASGADEVGQGLGSSPSERVPNGHRFLLPPSRVETPRLLSASAIARRMVAPVFWISATIGSTFAARRLALALRTATPASRAADELLAAGLSGAQRGSLRDEGPLLLRA